MSRYILDIDWDVPNMPKYVGPFSTEAEAREFARLNVPNGIATCVPLQDPYARISGGSR